MSMRISPDQGFQARGASRQLVVLLHGSTLLPSSLDEVRDVAGSLMPDADIWTPRLPLRWAWTRARASNITEAIVLGIGQAVEARALRGGVYEEITVLGHSFGAVLARAVWSHSMGGQPDGTADLEKAQPWAKSIRRLVLLAATARGWNPMMPVRTGIRFALWLGSLLEAATGPGYALLDGRRGAPWISTTRLQTMALDGLLKRERIAPPVVVQLLGTVDDIVAPSDNVDLATGGRFHYIEVPRTGHMDIIHLKDGPGRPCDSLSVKAREVRSDRIRLALVGGPEELRAAAVPVEVLRDMVAKDLVDHDVDWADPGIPGHNEGALPVRPEVARVVFLTHGIRDYGHWTHRLAVRLKDIARGRGMPVRTVTSSYGFFPMGPFLLRAQRRVRAGWLMDNYVTARALYPNAEICFVGHSNGTYLAANALKECPAIRFKEIVFAGSVVRTNFEWPDLSAKGQVGRVLNYVATGDIVVALFPGGMQWLRFPDLGGAGHHGFEREGELVRNVRWVPGGRGAALEDHHWDEIAEFVLGGVFPSDREPVSPWRAKGHGWFVGIVGQAAGLALLLVAALVVSAIGLTIWGMSAYGIVGLVIGLPLLTLLAMRVLTRL